jgi:hypothetical protein
VLDRLSLTLPVTEMLPLLVTLDDGEKVEVSVCTKVGCSETQQ